MTLFKYIALLVLGLSLSLHASADEINGVMMIVKGDIKVTSAKEKKTSAGKVGTKVFPGDSITAGPDSRAKIVMSDKNVINLSPDTKITVEKYENDGKTKNVELNVSYGKVRASVEQKYDGEKSKFNIRTPSAVAGVRGTDFMTGYNAGTKATQIITFTGTVAVGAPGPGGSIVNPVFVQPGQMTNVGAGQKPEAPKSVPKEELNKMNTESKADTAQNKQGGDTANAQNDKPEKKDAEKSDKAADKADSPGDKPAVAGDAGDKGEKPVDKKDGKSEGKREPAAVAGGEMGNKEGGPGSPPGGPGGGSMLDSSLLGPGAAAGIEARSPNGPPPPPQMTFRPPLPGMNIPQPNPFINDAIRNKNARIQITIEKGP